MFNSIITFVKTIPNGTVDEYGDPVDLEVKRDVFCAILSIGQTEFYQAQTVGVKPQIKAVISDYLDYQDEEEAIVEGIRYKILRTYRKMSNELEITLYGGVRDANA